MSSLIEDTYAEVDELLLFEVEPLAEPPRASIREVANHVHALEIGLARLAEVPISSRLIREVHGVLLSAMRGGESSKTPGEFRRSQNWIGRPGSNLKTATFVPPPPHELEQLLSKWEIYLHAESDEPDLIKAALLHYQFEAIHPFLDGNGRIGRLLITLFFCARGTLSQPLLYLSAYFEKHRDDYYRHLLTISTRGDWHEWLIYFLTGVRDTARDALADTHAITDLHHHYRSILDASKRPPTAAAGMLDSLFGSPMLSIPVHASRSGESYQNVSKAVAFWQKHGLVTEITNQRRHRIFTAPEIIKLTRAKP